MSDDTTVLQEEIRLTGTEKAVRALNAVAGAGGRLAEKLRAIGSIAMVVAGIGGLFELGQSVREADDLYRTVSRVSGATGMAAKEAFGMLEAFKLNGIELEGGERIMLALARNASKLSDSMMEGAQAGAKLHSVMAAMGVKADAGPAERIVAMAKAAQIGKLSINDMITGFGISRQMAMAMMAMLKKGPEGLTEAMKKAMGSAGAITDASLETFRKMQQARRELSESWGDLVRILYVSVMPLVTSVLGLLKDGFEAIAPVVERIGAAIRKFTPEIKAAIVALSGLKLAAMATNLASGSKFGAIGLARGAVGGLASRLTTSTISGPLAPGAVRMATNGFGMLIKSGGLLARVMGSAAMMTGVVVIAFAAIAGGIYLFVKMVENNTFGIRDALNQLWKRLQEFYEQIRPMGAQIWAAVQPLIEQFKLIAKGQIATVIMMVIAQLKIFAGQVAAITEFLNSTVGKIVGPGFLQNVGRFRQMLNGDDDADVSSSIDKKVKPPPDKNPGTNMDFRGSRFEITQNFAPGFDANRVAVSFQSQLTKIGERRLDSGLRPAFGYR